MTSGCDDPPAGGRGRGGADAGRPGSDPVLLATIYDPVEAEIVVARLRSAGIRCYLRHEAAGAVYGLTVDGMGRQDIMVRADELEEARAALETEAEGEE